MVTVGLLSDWWDLASARPNECLVFNMTQFIQLQSEEIITRDSSSNDSDQVHKTQIYISTLNLKKKWLDKSYNNAKYNILYTVFTVYIYI